MPTKAAKQLHGKTVLITGASSGIGRSCAFEFARTSPSSLKLILTARRVDRLNVISQQIKKELGDGVQVHVAKLDVSKSEEIERFWKELPEDFKEVDILVNNAGFMSGYERAPDIPPQIIEDVWATNVTGLIHMTQEFLKIAKKRKNEDGFEGGRGDVVMIGSIAGREAYAGGSIYCASKAAVRSFTDALRKELISTRIRVITVDPGQVLTVSVSDLPGTSREILMLPKEFTVIRNRGDEASADKVYEYVRHTVYISVCIEKLTRLRGCDPLTPDDIAEVVVFACSRRENMVVADSMLFPNYQVILTQTFEASMTNTLGRHQLSIYIGDYKLRLGWELIEGFITSLTNCSSCHEIWIVVNIDLLTNSKDVVAVEIFIVPVSNTVFIGIAQDGSRQSAIRLNPF